MEIVQCNAVDDTPIQVRESMLAWCDSVCVLRVVLFPISDSSVSPGGRGESFEIEKSLARLSFRKSPGWNGMTAEMCKVICMIVVYRGDYFPAFSKTIWVVQGHIPYLGL